MEKKMAFDIEAEKAVLAAALLDPSAFPAARTILDPDDFVRDSHRLIWAAFGRMADVGIAIDQLTLKRYLESRGALDHAGGAPYIIDLCDNTFVLANWAEHVRIVKGYSVLNMLEDIAIKTDACVSRREDPSQILDAMMSSIAAASQHLNKASRPLTAQAKCPGCSSSVPAGGSYCPQCGLRQS